MRLMQSMCAAWSRGGQRRAETQRAPPPDLGRNLLPELFPTATTCKGKWESGWKNHENNQEDVNADKLTVKKWWIFGADFFTVYAEFFTVYKGHKRWKKNLVIDDFSRLVFHGLPPLETRDMTRFYAILSAWSFYMFSRLGAISTPKYRQAGEKNAKNSLEKLPRIQWRLRLLIPDLGKQKTFCAAANENSMV